MLMLMFKCQVELKYLSIYVSIYLSILYPATVLVGLQYGFAHYPALWNPIKKLLVESKLNG